MINERLRPNIVRPTELGNFYCIDNEYVANTIMWTPVKTTGDKEILIPVEVPSGSRAPRVQKELLLPCVYVTQPSALNGGEFNVSHVLLRLIEATFETLRKDSEAYTVLHTSCLLPESRKAKPDEPFLVPLICYKKERTIGNRIYPYLQTAAVEDVRLFSPEIEKFYTETLPTWEIPRPMSWNELRLNVLSGNMKLNFPFIIPNAALYIESNSIPEEVVEYIREYTRKGTLR